MRQYVDALGICESPRIVDTIELELAGVMIAVTFRPKTGDATTCHIDLPSAVELSCLLLRSSSLKTTTSITVPGMTVQVEGGRAPQGWLTMTQNDDPNLMARNEGQSVREIGRRIHDHWLTAKRLSCTGPERSIFVRPVSYFCLAGEELHRRSRS